MGIDAKTYFSVEWLSLPVANDTRCHSESYVFLGFAAIRQKWSEYAHH